MAGLSFFVAGWAVTVVAFTTSADLYQAFLYVAHHNITQATEPAVSESLLARLLLDAIHVVVIHSQAYLIHFTQSLWWSHMEGKYLWKQNTHVENIKHNITKFVGQKNLTHKFNVPHPAV